MQYAIQAIEMFKIAAYDVFFMKTTLMVHQKLMDQFIAYLTSTFEGVTFAVSALER